MKRVIVASTNPVKIDAGRLAFEKMFPDEAFTVEGLSVPSGVPDQPKGDAETYEGARTRLEGIRAAEPHADYWIAFEGGIADKEGEMEAFAWVMAEDAGGRKGKGRSATFFLPPAVAGHIRDGKELGEADDIVFGLKNSKQQKGTVGILTHDLVTRTTYYMDAAILALIPFKNPSLY